MALKVLMLRKKLGEKQTELAELRKTAAGFLTRETELEKSIEEADTEEEKAAVEEAIGQFEQEQGDNTAAVSKLEGEISDIEKEIEELERSAPTPPKAGEAGRKENMKNMETRTFFGMTMEQRDMFMAREDVKDFLQRARQLKSQQRDITGAELGIPEVMLPILRDNVDKYSKLLKHITCKPLNGKARQNIAGAIPEAVWTEAISNLNELKLDFHQIEVDGYKVGGYLAIPNSTLEDDDNLSLAATILDMLGQAIGLAVDKAIIYGTGAKMPVGYMTRLAAATQPSWWGTNQGKFTDLHTSNILKLNLATSTGEAFFATLIAALGVASPSYAINGPVWVMNRKTHIDIMAKALAFNSAAALTAGVNGTMPIVGGDIVELEFVPDYEISGGYLDLMRWSERSGANLRSSDIPLMLQEQTVFLGSQRYDGKPARGEAFVAVNYHNTEVTTTKSFETDYANSTIGTLIVTTAASTSASGKTVVTVAGASDGADLKYKKAGTPLTVTNGEKMGSGWDTITSGSEVAAETGSYITVVEVDDTGKAVKVGAGVATAKA